MNEAVQDFMTGRDRMLMWSTERRGVVQCSLIRRLSVSHQHKALSRTILICSQLWWETKMLVQRASEDL